MDWSLPDADYAIFLDDERSPQAVTWLTLPVLQWTVVRLPLEFKVIVQRRGLPRHISFDNDLGLGETEGRHLAKWLTDRALDRKVRWRRDFRYTVHSKNNVAAAAIHGTLSSFHAHLLEHPDSVDWA